MTSHRSHSGAVDALLVVADEALRVLAGVAAARRESPGEGEPEVAAEEIRRESAALMRVNHTGEICAQALYSGQALVARDSRVRAALQAAAADERDHLAWCRDRLSDLGSRRSLLDPLWYAGSFAMGVASAVAGDRWSLGFLAETEAQVERHLASHLERLSLEDRRSRAIVAQMREDEDRHGRMGRDMGGIELPYPVRRAMQSASKMMTRVAYWV
jgi:ubiquinone biosynthesis monooxygenase Coq7